MDFNIIFATSFQMHTSRPRSPHLRTSARNQARSLPYQLPQNLTEIPTRMTVPLIRMNTRTLSKLHQNHLVREYMPANIVRSCVHVQLWCVGCVH